VHLYFGFSTASDGATVERQVQNAHFYSIFLPVWWSIASPIMHRCGRCFHHMLEDRCTLHHSKHSALPSVSLATTMENLRQNFSKM